MSASIRPWYGPLKGKGKTVRPPPAATVNEQQMMDQPRAAPPLLAQPRSNDSASAQVGSNVPQALTFERQQSSNDKVMYDMVQSSNANTHAMATQMAASFAAAATASNAQAMQTVHSMQATHAASSGSLMNQMAESSRQALDQMKDVVSELMRHGMHAQPMCNLPPPPMPPPNWAMSGGSSGSGGQNPTPVQWTQWSENPTADTDWPGWQVQQTWTPTVAPPPSAATTWTPTVAPQDELDDGDDGEISSSSGTSSRLLAPQTSAEYGYQSPISSSDEEMQHQMYIPEYNDQFRHRRRGEPRFCSGWQRPEHKGLGHHNRLYRHTLFKL
tara:strand:+ start:141 stop:1124 length:984 start_codon:yes stop_codon:yes gene_type:complete